MFVWHKSRYVGFSMYIIKADLQVELICLSGEGRLSNQTSIFLAYFDVFIWHLVVGSKRVWLVDCSWGRLWLVSQRNSLPNFSFVLVDSPCSPNFFLHPHRELVCRLLACMSVRTENESGRQAGPGVFCPLLSSPRPHSSPPAISIVPTDQDPGLFNSTHCIHPVTIHRIYFPLFRSWTWIPTRSDHVELKCCISWFGQSSYSLEKLLQLTYFFTTISYSYAYLSLPNELDLPNSCYGYNSPPKSFEGPPVKSARKLVWIMRRILR